MIGGQDYWTFAWHAVPIVNAPAEVGREDQAGEAPRRPIRKAHALRFHYRFCGSAALRLRSLSSPCLTSEMISELVCSGVISELLMTRAPSATISGAAARWLSR